MKLKKYVVFDQYNVVPFDAPLQHKDMVKLGTITSAGYYALGERTVQIAGEALSIDIPNGPHDREILERFFFGHVER